MFVPVAKVEEIEPGTVKPLKAGETELAVARVGDEFYAVQGHCLHLQGPLGHGKLDDHLLRCPWHGWTYDLRGPRRGRGGHGRSLSPGSS